MNSKCRPVSLRAEMDRLAAGGEMPSHDRHRRRVQSTADEPPPPNPPARASTATRKMGTLADYSQFRKHVRHFKRMEIYGAQVKPVPLPKVSNAEFSAAINRAFQERARVQEHVRAMQANQRRVPAVVVTVAEDEPHIDPRSQLAGEPDPYHAVLAHQDMCHPFPLEQCPLCRHRRCPIEPAAWTAMSDELDELQDLASSKQVRFRAYRVIHHVLTSDPFSYHEHLTQDGTPWTRLKLPRCLKTCVRATFPTGPGGR